ncbi:MAG: cupin domain-containing protein [Polaromonas sp.]|nr:cupin domain-containing protein [Gemmatimonadaceae bacterium]
MSASAPFVRGTEAEWEVAGVGVRRQILGYGDDLMMVRVAFDAGATGALHHHPHRQATYVAAGRFEVTVGEEVQQLDQGDCFFAIAEVPHGVRALTAGMLVDTFTPARADFLTATS